MSAGGVAGGMKLHKPLGSQKITLQAPDASLRDEDLLFPLLRFSVSATLRLFTFEVEIFILYYCILDTCKLFSCYRDS